jgi:site-specific recombinase XerC
VPDVLVPSLRDPEMRGLLTAAAGSKDPLRDQAIVSLLLDAGIRLSELIGIRIGDLDLVEGRCRIRGKGAHERLVPVGGRCRRSLRAWLASRGRVDAGACPCHSEQFSNSSGDLLPRRGSQTNVPRTSCGTASREHS